MWPWLGPVPTYGVLYFTGIIIHFIVSYLIARRLELRHRVWIAVSVCYMVAMTVGAKALYDVKHGQFGLWMLITIRHYMQGGLWGGLLAYFALAVPLAFVLAERKHAALDLVALSLPGPLILAKLGCLFNGCCYGRPSSLPWAITFPEGARGAPPGIPLHPTQIYELLVIVCIILVFKLLNNERWRGTMLLWFFIVYGLGRAATEFFRGDADRMYVEPLTLSQIVCLVSAGTSILALYLWRRPHIGPSQDTDN
jgi:phosphatidylglycerol:prolipoprotein diacylglycerol transferase